jgi:hypothetical protein
VHGHTIDFLLTPHRDQQAAQDFLTKAIRRHSVPAKLTIDGSEANAAAIRSYRVPYHDLGPEHFDRLATERLTRHDVHRLEQLSHRVPLNTEVAWGGRSGFLGNLLYDETRWQEERHQTYVTLQLPSDADRALAQLHTDFAQVATAAAQGLAQNPFATIVDGRLHLKRRDALEVSAQVRALRRVMERHLPPVRIEDLLREVDTWCQFTRALQPLVGALPLAARFYPTLPAALVAHGTNLGIAFMGESTEGITVDILHEVSHACLRL